MSRAITLMSVGAGFILYYFSTERHGPFWATEVPIEDEAFSTDRERAIDLSAALEKAFAILKVEERTAVTLTAVEEFTNDEAAEIMRIPAGTLKSHVFRGKEQMRKVLSRYGFEVEL